MTLKDSKGKVIRAPKDFAMTSANLKWWKVAEKDMAASVAATIRQIQQNQNSRLEQLTVSTRLYGNAPAYNLQGLAFARSTASNANPMTQRISFNLSASIIETLSAKMAKNKVIPTYITNGALWDVQKKAKQLTKFTQGLFYQEDVHRKVVQMFVDAGIWGDGFLHIFEKDKKVCIERQLPHEIWTDGIEGTVAEPTQLHRTRFMDRDIAAELYPELSKSIDTVAEASYQEIGGAKTVSDLITVVESWHLPSGPDAKDGVHAISIGDESLAEDYDKDYFPFAHYRYVRRPLGWYGQGCCERVQNLQGEINRSMILKQRSLWMMASFKVLVENGSKIVSQHLDNEVATIIHYTGTPPQYVTPPATNPELQAWIDSLIQKGYDQEGVPKMATTGEAPLGVESGKALRTLTQIGDDRFTQMGQELEDTVLDVAKQAVNVVKDIHEDEGSYEVKFPDVNSFETIDWKDIDLDEDQYTLKAYPTSSLSEDLTGRLSEIQELTQAGMIAPRASRRLMDMPDLEMADNLANAAEDLLHKKIEEMLYDGKVYAPEQFNDLQLAKQLALQYYNYGQYCNAPEDRLQILRDFLAQIGDIDGSIQAATQPQAAPMPQPQSNLVPNVPQTGAA